MAVLAAVGFEAGDIGFYRAMGWLPRALEVVGSDAGFVHKDGSGDGGTYSLLLDNGIYSPIFSTDARWLHLWFRKQTETEFFYISFRKTSEGQFDVRILNTGYVALYRGYSLVATSATPLDDTVGHWISLFLDAKNAAEECSVYIDVSVSPIVTFTGDTRHLNDNYGEDWNQVLIGNDGQEVYVDDVIVTDAATGEIGECYGVAHNPDGAGSVTEWTPSAGANYAAVALPLSDVTYVDSGYTGVDEDDLYTVDRPFDISEVKFVALNVRSGAQADYWTKIAVKSGSTTDYSAAMYLSQGGLGGGLAIWEDDPDTAAPWDQAGIEGLEIGLRTGT